MLKFSDICYIYSILIIVVYMISVYLLLIQIGKPTDKVFYV